MNILKNLNKISLRIIIQKLLINCCIIFFIRLGSFLPIPGINHTDLAIYIQANSLVKNFVTTFSIDDTLVIGLFTLNIFPYINASIVLQLFTNLVPYLSKLRKEGDLKSRRTLNKLIRILTLILAIIQSMSLGLYLRQILFNWNLLLFFQIILWLTTGAMIILWLSELITDYGLGNGASLLIYINIISSFPYFWRTINHENFNNNIISNFISMFLIFLSLFSVISLQEGIRRLPLSSSRQLNLSTRRTDENINMYLPLKLNQAGVMPIILTTVLLILPNSLMKYFPIFNTISLNPFLLLILNILYWIIYFSLILGFSLYYSTIVLNPKDISDQLQKSASIIPNIRPGVKTTFFLKKVMQRLTILGSITLAIIAILPNIIEAILHISDVRGLSASSLLITAGVMIEVLREINDLIYSNIYTYKKK